MRMDVMAALADKASLQIHEYGVHAVVVNIHADNISGLVVKPQELGGLPPRGLTLGVVAHDSLGNKLLRNFHDRGQGELGLSGKLCPGYGVALTNQLQYIVFVDSIDYSLIYFHITILFFRITRCRGQNFPDPQYFYNTIKRSQKLAGDLPEIGLS